MSRLLLAIVVVGLATTGVRADQIDKQMVDQADKIAAAVATLGAKNVAVLTFEFKVGDAEGTFTAGTVNARMATRLEHLLILKNDPKKPRFVLANAGAVLADIAEKSKTPITWRTAAGRKQIAQVGKLPLAWDDKTELAPDGFVTGAVVTAADYKTTAVKFYGFTTADPATLKELYTLDDKADGAAVRTDRSMLASYGQSFNLTATARSMNMEADDAEAVQDAAKRDASNAPPVAAQGHQPDENQSPIRLQIFFDGKEQPWTQVAGEPRIAVTPKRDQKVHFLLTNTSATESYGVLLAVNGKNTNAISNDSLTDKAAHDQRKWVLGPKDSYKIEGFYTNAKGDFNPFEVMPEEESAKAFDQLNPTFRGKISLLVFGKRQEETEKKADVKPEPQKARDDTATASAIDLAGGAWKIRATGSLVEAQKLLRASTHVQDQDGKLAVALVEKSKYAAGKRGLLTASAETRSSGEIKQVELVYDPLPMCCVHVVYYVPAPKGQ